MTLSTASLCPLCRKPARRSEKISGRAAFWFDCAACGTYEIGSTTCAQYATSLRDEAFIQSLIVHIHAANRKRLMPVVPTMTTIANHHWLTRSESEATPGA